MAIIGVVVCHQINFLHTSNWINCFTIYAVPLLILCAGITKSFSIKKYILAQKKGNLKYDWTRYTIKSLKSICLSYLLCCMVYGVYYGTWDGVSIKELLDVTISFRLSPPFYFLEYYIMLSILAPFLYFIVSIIESKINTKIILVITEICFLICLWCMGYVFRRTFSALGCSYLFIYALGLIVGKNYENVAKNLEKRKIIFLMVWLISIVLASNTFWASIETTKVIGLDKMIEYTINPPNFSVTLYAIMTGVIICCLYMNTDIKKMKITKVVEWGKYSLDIYLWHIIIQHLCVRLNLRYSPNIWILRIIAYTMMFGFPILGRYLYTKIKQKITLVL